MAGTPEAASSQPNPEEQQSPENQFIGIVLVYPGSTDLINGELFPLGHEFKLESGQEISIRLATAANEDGYTVKRHSFTVRATNEGMVYEGKSRAVFDIAPPSQQYQWHSFRGTWSLPGQEPEVAENPTVKFTYTGSRVGKILWHAESIVAAQQSLDPHYDRHLTVIALGNKMRATLEHFDSSPTHQANAQFTLLMDSDYSRLKGVIVTQADDEIVRMYDVLDHRYTDYKNGKKSKQVIRISPLAIAHWLTTVEQQTEFSQQTLKTLYEEIRRDSSLPETATPETIQAAQQLAEQLGSLKMRTPIELV